MLSTYVSYQIIARDLPKALDRVEKQPMVSRETAYYLENITKVRTVEEFVADRRLFSYAMKAFGLEDMTYAKALMVKAMKEGVSDRDSFANRLSDKRYAEFVATFDFAAHGENTMSYNKAQHEVTANYITKAGADAGSDEVRTETAYYLANIVKVGSIDELMANQRLLDYALTAYGFDPAEVDADYLREMLEGGVADPESPANKETDTRYKAFVSAFNFQALGAAATTYSRPQQLAVDRFMRQTLEENAGDQNQGVQLALYFQRKASSITSGYGILADKALTKVVYTALGLPDSFANADVDKQAAFLESRLRLEDFQDPEKLGRFLQRFTAMWDASNQDTSRPSPYSILLGQPTQAAVSTNLLMTLMQMKR